MFSRIKKNIELTVAEHLDIKTLVKITILRYIQDLRTLAYVMWAYSKPCQISKMMSHIENLTQSEQFIQAYAWAFSNIQSCSDMLRNIKVY